MSLQYLKGACKKAGEGLSSMACIGKTRRNGSKLAESRFRWDTRKKFVTVGVVRHWNWCVREAVGAPSLDIDGRHLKVSVALKC